MLTGMLTSLALAPVVFTVSRVVQTQREYSDMSALSRTINFIERDVFSAMRLASTVIVVTNHEAMGRGDDDTLMIMSTAPAAQNMPSGTIVYKIEEGGMMHNNVIPGLYRWIFSGVAPSVIRPANLTGEDAQLVLPDVTQFSVEIPINSRKDERRKEYRGTLPEGMYIKIVRNDNETLERTLVFP